MITKTHQFFLLQDSPWPLVASINAFNTFCSILLLMKLGEIGYMVASMLATVLTSLFWWVLYSGEFNLEGKSSDTLEQGVKHSVVLFILSEIFFFISFFWSYFHFSLSPSLESSMVWPPLGTTAFDFTSVPLVNTLVLLSSGLTVTISHHYMSKNVMSLSSAMLVATIILGAFFTSLQVMEYGTSFFEMGDGTFGGSFFMLTGFHGLHVVIGTVFLGISLCRMAKVACNSTNCLVFELASWYWHFVDVVWIFLYFFLYYLNG